MEVETVREIREHLSLPTVLVTMCLSYTLFPNVCNWPYWLGRHCLTSSRQGALDTLFSDSWDPKDIDLGSWADWQRLKRLHTFSEGVKIVRRLLCENATEEKRFSEAQDGCSVAVVQDWRELELFSHRQVGV
jgi:hypothetical protein